MNTTSTLTKTLTKKATNTNQLVGSAREFVSSYNGDFKAAIDIINTFIELTVDLSNQIGLNCLNSSIPPSQDKRKTKKIKPDCKVTKDGSPKKKQGGQSGHQGVTLELVDNPDETIKISVDTSTLPPDDYHDIGVERRQTTEVVITKIVREYQAQVVINSKGKIFIASFPEGVTHKAQYGSSIKLNAVYMAIFQLIPYDRLQQHFHELYNVNISKGTLYNFQELAFKRLDRFEQAAKHALINGNLIYADETGINVGGKRIWLHNTSNELWTLMVPHEKRGNKAMDEINILPHFEGVVSHDYWRAYFKYMQAKHSLCNAHHLRELLRAYEQDGQTWAQKMHQFLTELNTEVIANGDMLSSERQAKVHQQYQALLKQAEIECPPPPTVSLEKHAKPKRGVVKRSKARNLLERLIKHPEDVLRFITETLIPFTNNQGERDIRMTKIHQKISGCFRSMKGAEMFCRIRSYISTCQKHGITVFAALESLFMHNTYPKFIQDVIDKMPAPE